MPFAVCILDELLQSLTSPFKWNSLVLVSVYLFTDSSYIEIDWSVS